MRRRIQKLGYQCLEERRLLASVCCGGLDYDPGGKQDPVITEFSYEPGGKQTPTFDYEAVGKKQTTQTPSLDYEAVGKKASLDAEHPDHEKKGLDNAVTGEKSENQSTTIVIDVLENTKPPAEGEKLGLHPKLGTGNTDGITIKGHYLLIEPEFYQKAMQEGESEEVSYVFSSNGEKHEITLQMAHTGGDHLKMDVF